MKHISYLKKKRYFTNPFKITEGVNCSSLQMNSSEFYISLWFTDHDFNFLDLQVKHVSCNTQGKLQQPNYILLPYTCIIWNRYRTTLLGVFQRLNGASGCVWYHFQFVRLMVLCGTCVFVSAAVCNLLTVKCWHSNSDCLLFGSFAMLIFHHVTPTTLFAHLFFSDMVAIAA